MQERKNIIKFGGNPVTLVGNETKVGEKAKEFTVLKNDMSELKLEDLRNKVIVISVFPSIDTPVCALQTARFNQEAAKHKNVTIITVSVDLPFALGRFCGAEGIENAITTSDHKDLSFGYNYGFVIKELRLLARGVVIIDKEGIVQHVEYCSNISDEPNYEKAMKAVEALI